MADPDERGDDSEDDSKDEEAPRDAEPWAKTSSGNADADSVTDDGD
jgi:hypothetical protein